MAGGYDPIEAAVSGGPMSIDVDWYRNLLATKDSWELVSTQYVKPSSGIAVDVPAGHTIRITQSEGPQINDINFFGADITDANGERYDLGYTLAIEGMLLPQFSRAWSGLPYFRPMATVIDDNIDASAVPEGTWPIWTGGHCSPEVVQSETGSVDRFACHSNFMEAARSRGLPESVAAYNNCLLVPQAPSPQTVKGSELATSPSSRWLPRSSPCYPRPHPPPQVARRPAMPCACGEAGRPDGAEPTTGLVWSFWS
jgi:hypothetical protein